MKEVIIHRAPQTSKSVGYFWITLTAMFCLYAGIYRVALDLHRRSEEKRKKLSMSLSTMAQQTIGHLGTAAIMMARNPKLDACLINAMPSAMQQISGNGNAPDNFPSENRVSVNRHSSRGLGDKCHGPTLMPGSHEDDDDSSSSCVSTPESKRKSQKKKETGSRRKSLLMTNQDIRMLMPRPPRQYLQLPVSTALADKGVKALATHLDTSDDDNSLKPFRCEIPRTCNSPPIRHSKLNESAASDQETVIDCDGLNLNENGGENISIVFDAVDSISNPHDIERSEILKLNRSQKSDSNKVIPILKIVNYDDEIQRDASIASSDAVACVINVDEGKTVSENISYLQQQQLSDERRFDEYSSLCNRCQETVAFNTDCQPNQINSADNNIYGKTEDGYTSNNRCVEEKEEEEEEERLNSNIIHRAMDSRGPGWMRSTDSNDSSDESGDDSVGRQSYVRRPRTAPESVSAIESRVINSENNIDGAMAEERGGRKPEAVERVRLLEVNVIDSVSLDCARAGVEGDFRQGRYCCGGENVVDFLPVSTALDGSNPTDSGPVVATPDSSSPLFSADRCDWLHYPKHENQTVIENMQTESFESGSEFNTAGNIWITPTNDDRLYPVSDVGDFSKPDGSEINIIPTLLAEVSVSLSSPETVSTGVRTHLSSDASCKTVDLPSPNMSNLLDSAKTAVSVRSSLDCGSGKTTLVDLSPTTNDELPPITSSDAQRPTSFLSAPRSPRNSTTPTLSPSTTSSALAFWNLISIRTGGWWAGDAGGAESQAAQRKRNKQQKKIENRARKALRTITVILGAFVLCWTPWHILSLIMGFCHNSERCVAPVLYDISYWLCYLNSPLNPFCYAFANQQFKKTFIRILKLDLHRS